ncbi:MAG: hypothetical protein ACREB3_10005 [Burkholderiales bacterium]
MDVFKALWGVGVAALGAVAIVAGVSWATSGVDTIQRETGINLPKL